MAAPPANCPSCGARIEATQGEQAYTYTCRFCGAHVPIDALAPKADPRAEVARLAEEMRRRREAEGAKAVASVAAAGSSIGCIVVGATLIPVLIPLFIFVGPLVKGWCGAHYGSFPIAVDTNDTLEIDGRDATGTDTLITVGVNGKLTLKNCHLKAPLIVKASTNAEITIVDSSLQGDKGIIEGDGNLTVHVQNSTITSGEEIIDSPVNTKVDVSKGSKITAAGTAFPLETNGEVSIDGSEVDGKMGAIEIKNNGKVKLAGSAVAKSDGPAIDLANNGELTITSSRVESKTVAVHAGYNLEGTLRGATLVGPKASLDIGSNSHLKVAQSSLQGPQHEGSNSSLGDPLK